MGQSRALERATGLEEAGFRPRTTATRWVTASPGGSSTVPSRPAEELNALAEVVVRERVVAVKLLWLAIRDVEDKRARQRAREAGGPAAHRTAPGFLIEGNTSQGWNAALGALSLAFADRLAPYLWPPAYTEFLTSSTG